MDSGDKGSNELQKADRESEEVDQGGQGGQQRDRIRTRSVPSNVEL